MSKTLRPRISLINLATFDKIHVIVVSYVLHVNMDIRLESLGVFGAAPARHHTEVLAWVLIRTLTFSEDLRRAAQTFRDQCNIQLRSLGFTLLGPEYIKQAGIEVDQVAVNRKDIKIYFEFKGGYEGDRPGLIENRHNEKGVMQRFLAAPMPYESARGNHFC